MSSNYFKLFKIRQAFDINSDELEKKYIELSRADISKKGSRNMKVINKAYQILKSPLKRAEYLLSLFGIERKKDHLSDDILNESLEIREYLIDCDDQQSPNRIISEKIDDCTKNLVDAFAKSNFDKAMTQTLRLKYLYKSFEEMRKNAINTDF